MAKASRRHRKQRETAGAQGNRLRRSLAAAYGLGRKLNEASFHALQRTLRSEPEPNPEMIAALNEAMGLSEQLKQADRQIVQQTIRNWRRGHDRRLSPDDWDQFVAGLRWQFPVGELGFEDHHGEFEDYVRITSDGFELAFNGLVRHPKELSRAAAFAIRLGVLVDQGLHPPDPHVFQFSLAERGTPVEDPAAELDEEELWIDPPADSEETSAAAATHRPSLPGIDDDDLVEEFWNRIPRRLPGQQLPSHGWAQQVENLLDSAPLPAIRKFLDDRPQLRGRLLAARTAEETKAIIDELDRELRLALDGEVASDAFSYDEQSLPAEYREGGHAKGDPLVFPYLSKETNWELKDYELAPRRCTGVRRVRVVVQRREKLAYRFDDLRRYREKKTERQAVKERRAVPRPERHKPSLGDLD